jgi:hypothetical protein
MGVSMAQLVTASPQGANRRGRGYVEPMQPTSKNRVDLGLCASKGRRRAHACDPRRFTRRCDSRSASRRRMKWTSAKRSHGQDFALAGRQGRGYRWALRRTQGAIRGIRHEQVTDIDRALEAWLKHPCLRVGDVLEIRPANEEFTARIAARDARVAGHC